MQTGRSVAEDAAKIGAAGSIWFCLTLYTVLTLRVQDLPNPILYTRNLEKLGMSLFWDNEMQMHAARVQVHWGQR